MSAAIPDERAALLAAIVAEPDADAPRLVYADWLQEHGDEEQAQFIRDSVALEWLSDHEDEKRQLIAQRLEGVADRNGTRWLEEVGVVGINPEYDRGMVESVYFDDVGQFAEAAPTLFARVPVRGIRIGGLVTHESATDWLAVLANMPDLIRLRELCLDNQWHPISSDEGWERFITSPNLANLQSLAVQRAGLDDENVRAFDRAKHLANLEELDLHGNWLTAVGALTVVRCPRLPNLTRLSLGANNIVEDRRRGALWMQLRDALFDRFNSTAAL